MTQASQPAALALAQAVDLMTAALRAGRSAARAGNHGHAADFAKIVCLTSLAACAAVLGWEERPS